MRTEGTQGSADSAGQCFELRVEKLERNLPATVLATGWNVLATLAGDFLPHPATSLVSVRDRRRRTVIYRERVSADDLDALTTALREDLAELDAQAFRDRWGRTQA